MAISNTLPDARRYAGIKRLFDIVGAVSGILLLAPLMAGIAIAIKVNSTGSVLFRQTRHGRNGSTFTILKFRSMYADLGDASGRQQTVRDDPRMTPVGRFLRRSNFDELPQLFNVLKGEMSLVGPRPHVPGMLAAGLPYEEFDPRYHQRHRVKPGITGLAQVNGYRGETKVPHAAHMRLEHDLAYVARHSPLLDIKIIFKTIVREFFKGNGY
ncbi:sugar transferase [Roseibium sp.]|uniref:sugar transferase n=1 Tax=Roseibium sp. TaxID=1936156 RepID=UPI003263A489